MRTLDYEQYSKLCVTINSEVGIDGEAVPLIAYPLIVDVAPGETVPTGYSGEYLTAPTEPGNYVLFHYVCGGQHSRWEWRHTDEKEAQHD